MRRSAGSSGLLFFVLAFGCGAPPPEERDPVREQMLIDAAGARALLTEEAPVKWVALTPADEFERGHIPSAVQVDWPALELSDTSSEAKVQAWRGQVAQQLGALGITADDDVVIYDGGTLFAARLWWILEHLGHPKKRVLDGGFAGWRAAGGEVATGPASPAAATYVPAALRPEVLATVDEVVASVSGGIALHVDARSPAEWQAGHLPGAVNIPYTTNAEGQPPLFKSRQALRSMYEAQGLTAEKKAIPYCTSGVRSAVTFFSLRMAGFSDVELFSGSWAEWSRDPTRPVEK